MATGVVSVVDSTEDLAQAKARLANLDADGLAAEISFWSIACLDATAEHARLMGLQRVVLEQYAEAQQWTSLVASELRTRRDARLGDRPPAKD